MKARQSDLAKRALAAGIRLTPGKPFYFEGKWYVPRLIRVAA